MSEILHTLASNREDQSSFDLIINGAGIVGLTHALLCAQNGFKVALVDPVKFDPITSAPSTITDYDVRVFAITRAAQKIFERIDVWRSISPKACPYSQMIVWDGGGFGKLEFLAEELNEPDLGHIIEQRVILNALWQKVNECSTIMFFHSIPSVLENTSEKINLILENGKILTSQWIVGADGAHSWVRKNSGIDPHITDYAQAAIVATVKTQYPHQATAWQRFLPAGPLAFLPLSHPHYCSIVWTHSKAETKTLLEKNALDFCASLGQAFDYKLGRIEEVGNRLSFPLKRFRTEPIFVKRAIFIGDAAHVVHPMAGQGLNLGLLDAANLAQYCQDLRKLSNEKANFDVYGQEKSIYSLQQLNSCFRQYERSRKGHIVSLITLTESLHRLFSKESTLKAALRGIGMELLGKLPPLKHKLMREAMGLSYQWLI